MTKYNGCTSEVKRCVFCNKVTREYMSYEVKGIEIRLHSHYACRKDLSDTAKICFSILKKEVEEIKCEVIK